MYLVVSVQTHSKRLPQVPKTTYTHMYEPAHPHYHNTHLPGPTWAGTPQVHVQVPANTHANVHQPVRTYMPLQVLHAHISYKTHCTHLNSQTPTYMVIPAPAHTYVHLHGHQHSTRT